MLERIARETNKILPGPHLRFLRVLAISSS